MLICQKIIEVMREIDAIAKDRRNGQGSGYQYRGIDDVYNELHEPMAKAGIFTAIEVLEERSEERSSKSGGCLIYRILKIKYTFYAEDGSNLYVIVIGEGMDSGDKASHKAMSVAHKYALMQIFCIPTKEAKDPEAESPEVRPRQQQEKPQQAKAQVKKQEAQVIEFSIKNTKQLEWLHKKLEAREVPLRLHDEVAFAMDGKPVSAESFTNILSDILSKDMKEKVIV